MNKMFLKDHIGWGFVLWAIGYVLGIILYFFVSPAVLGWVIMPIGALVTILVLWKKIKSDSFMTDLSLSLAWLILAVVCDYLFLVKLFKPVGGYYALDVYLYYGLTFALPLIVGRYKRFQQRGI